jgi:hypothetical protein
MDEGPEFNPLQGQEFVFAITPKPAMGHHASA